MRHCSIPIFSARTWLFDLPIIEFQLKREDVFITSKLWNVYHSTQKVSEGIDQILKELHIPYLDMLLIHWPQGYAENHGMFPKVRAWFPRTWRNKELG